MFSLRRPGQIVAGVLYVATLVLTVLGSSSAAIVCAATATMVLIPTSLMAESRPRAGLHWEGGAAEPWRAERSPGEPTVIAESQEASRSRSD